MDFVTIFFLLAFVAGVIYTVRIITKKKGGVQKKPIASSNLVLWGFIVAALGLVAYIFSLSSPGGYSLIPIFGMIMILGFITLLIGLCFLIADMAQAKGRSWLAFFLLSLLISPLITWLIAASLSPLPGSAEYVAPAESREPQNAESLPQQIEKLGELRDKGLITQKEFAEKKKELLDRM